MSVPVIRLTSEQMLLPKNKQYLQYNGKNCLELKSEMNESDCKALADRLSNEGQLLSKGITESKDLSSTINKLKSATDPDWQQKYRTDQERDALNQVANKLNSQIHTLADEYDGVTANVNVNALTLNKASDFITQQNTNLQQQLNQLDKLQNNISTKSQLIMINKEHEKKQGVVIRGLLGFFVMLPIVGGINLAYMMGRLDYKKAMMINLVLFALFGIYMYFVVKSTRKPAWKPTEVQQIEGGLANVGRTIYDTGRRLEKKFIDENCDCPPKKHKSKYPKMKENCSGLQCDDTPVQNKTGFYYQDGSAPNQRIAPPIMSKAQSASYNPVTCEDGDTGCTMSQEIEWDHGIDVGTDVSGLPQPNKKVEYVDRGSWTMGL